MLQRTSVTAHRTRPTQKSYRAAVADVIRSLKADHRLSNRDLADRIGCSDQTIANAENERADLSAVLLLSIEFEFGYAAIDPVMELAGARIEPADELFPEDGDVDELAQASLEYAGSYTMARDPRSDGGCTITRQERASLREIARRLLIKARSVVRRTA